MLKAGVQNSVWVSHVHNRDEGTSVINVASKGRYLEEVEFEVESGLKPTHTDKGCGCSR